MNRIIIVVVTLFLLVSCSKNSKVSSPVVTNNADTVQQYGTPFTGVPDSRDAVIYQINMRCFSVTRNF